MTVIAPSEIRARIRKTGCRECEFMKFVELNQGAFSAMINGKRTLSNENMRRVYLGLEFIETMTALSRLPVDFKSREVLMLWRAFRKQRNRVELQAPAPRAAEETASHFTATT
jgi:hypothetical protein